MMIRKTVVIRVAFDIPSKLFQGEWVAVLRRAKKPLVEILAKDRKNRRRAKHLGCVTCSVLP